MARFVVELDDDVFTKVFERNFFAESRAEVPHLARPLLKLRIVSDAAFERERFIFRAAGRFARATGIASLAMLHHFGRALERADFADPGHVASVPFDLELEILVGIESLRLNVHTELCHDFSSENVS